MSKVDIKRLDSVTNNDTTATATINQNFENLQQAIENSLSRLGSTPNFMDADLDMNSYRIINGAAPKDPNDYVTLEYVEERFGDAAQYAEAAETFAEQAKSYAQQSLVANSQAQAAASSAENSKNEAEAIKVEIEGLIDDLPKTFVYIEDGNVINTNGWFYDGEAQNFYAFYQSSKTLDMSKDYTVSGIVTLSDKDATSGNILPTAEFEYIQLNGKLQATIRAKTQPTETVTVLSTTYFVEEI